MESGEVQYNRDIIFFTVMDISGDDRLDGNTVVNRISERSLMCISHMEGTKIKVDHHDNY